MTTDTEPDYISGVIQTLQLSGENTGQLPETLCVNCPSAMWWMDKQGPRCYCRQTHLMTWTDSEKPTLLGCDGYELAMARRRVMLMGRGRNIDESTAPMEPLAETGYENYGDDLDAMEEPPFDVPD